MIFIFTIINTFYHYHYWRFYHNFGFILLPFFLLISLSLSLLSRDISWLGPRNSFAPEIQSKSKHDVRKFKRRQIFKSKIITVWNSLKLRFVALFNRWANLVCRSLQRELVIGFWIKPHYKFMSNLPWIT